MPQVRREDVVRGVVAVAAVAATVAAELESHWIASFFADHPLQAGLVSGAILSLVAYWVINAVLAAVHEKRWRPLSALAFKALASETTLVIDVMAWLVWAIEPRNEAAPHEREQRCLTALHAAAALAPVDDGDLGDVRFEEYRSRLLRLLGSDRWLVFAHDTLDRWKWRNRRRIGEWAAAMLTTGESAEVLNRLAHLNDHLSTLQEWLRARRRQPGYEDFDAAEAEACDVWFSVIAEAISVREDLMTASGRLPPTWARFRLALRAADRAKIEGRAARSSRSDRAARSVLVSALVAAVPSPSRHER
jgi:hypothetical protein